MTLSDYLILKTRLRDEQDKVLAEAGLTLKQFIDLEQGFEQDIAEDFTATVGEYDFEVEIKPRYVYPKSSGMFVSNTKHIKIHKINRRK